MEIRDSRPACLYFRLRALLVSHLSPLFSFPLDSHLPGLTYDEFKERIKKLPTPAPVFLNRDDFDIITEHGILCDAAGEFGRDQFQAMMRGEMKNYAQRQMASAMEWTQSRESKSIMLMLKIVGISIETIAKQVRDLHRKIFEEKGKVPGMEHQPAPSRHGHGQGEYSPSLLELSAHIQTIITAQQDQSDKLDCLLKQKLSGDAKLPASSVDGGSGTEEDAGGESEVEARLTAAAEVLCDVQDAVEAQDEKLDKVLSMVAAADERHSHLAPLVESLRKSLERLQQRDARAASPPAARTPDTQHGADGAGQRETDAETANLQGGSFPSSPHTPTNPPTPSERSGAADQSLTNQADGIARRSARRRNQALASNSEELADGARPAGKIASGAGEVDQKDGDGGRAGRVGGRAGAGESMGSSWRESRVLAPPPLHPSGSDASSRRNQARTRDRRHSHAPVQLVDNGCDTVYVPGLHLSSCVHCLRQCRTRAGSPLRPCVCVCGVHLEEASTSLDADSRYNDSRGSCGFSKRDACNTGGACRRRPQDLAEKQAHHLRRCSICGSATVT